MRNKFNVLGNLMGEAEDDHDQVSIVMKIIRC
jgi:hypothetical protein